MSRPPRSADQPFFGAKKILIAASSDSGCWSQPGGLFHIARMGYEIGETRAMTFTTLIVANVMTILTTVHGANRSLPYCGLPILRQVGCRRSAFIIFLVLIIPFLQGPFPVLAHNNMGSLLSIAAESVLLSGLSSLNFQDKKIHVKRVSLLKQHPLEPFLPPGARILFLAVSRRRATLVHGLLLSQLPERYVENHGSDLL